MARRRAGALTPPDRAARRTELRTHTRDDAGAAASADVVVVVDVLRAFTTASFAVALGATEVVLVATPEEGFRERDRRPGSLLLGEDGAVPIDGFDLSNSPLEVLGADVAGRRLVHRSSSGTRAALAAATGRARVLCASLVNAHATADAIAPGEEVAYVLSGASRERAWDDADDDLAGAEAVEGLRTGQVDAAALHRRVHHSRAAARLRELALPTVEADLRLATSALRAPALELDRTGDAAVLRPRRPR